MEDVRTMTGLSAPPDIPFEVAAHVLFEYGAGGYAAGSFTTKLLSLISSADPTNRARLEVGFPAYVAAVDLAENSADGIAVLTGIFDTGITGGSRG